jgi:uncharacterized repeat protein (TIGR01451 family)
MKAGRTMLLALAGLLGLLSPAGPARADYINDVGANPVPPFNNFMSVYPNWKMLPTSNFSIYECDDVTCSWCLTSSIVGVTMFNYGNATGGPGADITGMYFKIMCASMNTAIFTMAYAGNWTVGTETYPAFTWAGAIPFTVDPNDTKNGCMGSASLMVYTDIGPCPTDGGTIELGPGYNDIDFGGITDDCWSTAPWAQMTDGNPKILTYIYKDTDRETAAPGDTIWYTLFLGKPGTSYSSLVVMDSQPPYTHLLFGSDVPPADPGFNPDPGPPARLRWTLPGATSAGGITQEIRFALTVDWGNGEMFEPGSGDVAAPEGFRLSNQAQAFWETNVGCGGGTKTSVSPAAETVAQRFLFWKVGSNDILFAPRIGMPNDEMVYDIFMKNLSPKKIWWEVRVWDTVPALLDVWSDGYGMEDPCTGWTMTPSGCAAAYAGKVISGTKTTILTWRVDMPPGMTLSLRWKAQLRPTSPSNATVISVVSLLELGNSNIVDGTGHSGRIATFVHLAPVVLRTTYYSYTAYAGACDDKNTPFGFLIPFFPLNQQTNFELRKLESLDPDPSLGLSYVGGKSATINVLVGSCVAGFSDGGFSHPGCKIERGPARYQPGIWDFHVSLWDGLGGNHFIFMYKVTSNSPVLWLTMCEGTDWNDDSFTYLPSTSLSYCGFMHYSARRVDEADNGSTIAGHGDRPVIINTGMDWNGAFNSANATTVHIFQWNMISAAWDYQKSGNIEAESIWLPFEGTYSTVNTDIFYMRVLSSSAQNIIYQSYHTLGAPGGGGAFDNHGGFAPCRETGNLVGIAPSTFYMILHPSLSTNLIVGNTGGAKATYDIYRYMPKSMKVASAAWPTTLAGSSGTWVMKASNETVNFGMAVPAPPITGPGNAHVYGGGYERTTMSATYATAWKVVLKSGGPIQCNTGGQIYATWSGGSNIHAADGGQSGDDFWFHHAQTDNSCGGPDATYIVNVFVPKIGIGVNMTSNDGYNATYTTDGVDQCIIFTALSGMNRPFQRNYRIQRTAASAPCDMIAQYESGKITEKFYTAPFVRTGIHYELVMPPTVYSGQNFWFTIIVVDNGGGTNTTYNGITSFTSSDSKAQMGGGGMEAYNYTWIPATDKGVHVFVNVIFNQLGLATIVAADIADGSIVGLGTIMVVGVDVKLTKEQRLTIAASGDTIRFRICWSNYSSASAFTFVVTDAVPMGTTYVPEVPSAMNCGSTDGVTMTVAQSNAAQSTPPASFTTVTSGLLPAGVRWLRWTVPVSGVQTTGCACFLISVN